MDDEMIIDLYWARAESAINETAIKYGNYCTKIAMNILQNKEDADECVNDTYLRTWNAIPPQRPIIFHSFLGKITRNLSLNRYKERKAKKRISDEITLLLNELEECLPSDSNVEAEYEAGMIAETINRFLYSIDSENRIVFVRRYWYADSIISISARFHICKISIIYVRNSLHRCQTE